MNQPLHFWANVRTISEATGYTERGTGRVKTATVEEVRKGLARAGLTDNHVIDKLGNLTPLGTDLLAYFEYRADRLNGFVEPRLMKAERAKSIFNDLRRKLKPTCPLPWIKQKGNKRTPAYLTGIINMLIESALSGMACDYDPRQLTTITKGGAPLRTLSRRLDGAFPGAVDPVAVWEIKEYYHTKTFGSRVADGVYESLLDGMELRELRENTGINVKHYLMLDAHFTWWDCGRSYLCRIIDMLHMGYVDEVLFGYEVVERLPEIVRSWLPKRSPRRRR